MENKSLPIKLVELRKMNNCKQAEVAAILGIARQTYSHYETGRLTPDTGSLLKLADYYGIDVHDLLILTSNVDPEVNFDVPSSTRSSQALDDLLKFTNDPENLKRLRYLTRYEKEMLFYFQKMSPNDQKELLSYAKFKVLEAASAR